MGIEILIASRNIGSNPGGKCVLPIYNRLKDAYVKYCNLSKMHSESSFDASHQPIYEIITLALAERLGLKVPQYFLLLNAMRDIVFNYKPDADIEKKLNPKKPYYLVSILVPVPSPHLKDRGGIETRELESRRDNKVLEREKLYRDFLLIADVEGKKQNYTYVSDDNGDHMLYIDLGCSFVKVHEGIMEPRIGRPIANTKDNQKKADDIAERYGIMAADESDLVLLSDLLNSIAGIVIPTLNPNGKIKVGDLLSPYEIEEIKTLLKLSWIGTISRYKKADDNRLVREGN